MLKKKTTEPATVHDTEFDELVKAWRKADADYTAKQSSVITGSAFYQPVQRIAVFYTLYRDLLPTFLAGKKVRSKSTSPFHPLVKLVAKTATEKRTGEVGGTSESMVSKISTILDHWHTHHQFSNKNGVPADQVAAWITGCGGIKRLYDSIKVSTATPKPLPLCQEARRALYHWLLTAPGQPQIEIPEKFTGREDGEYVIAAKLDPRTSKLTIRAAWKPDASFWLRYADKIALDARHHG